MEVVPTGASAAWRARGPALILASWEQPTARLASASRDRQVPKGERGDAVSLTAPPTATRVLAATRRALPELVSTARRSRHPAARASLARPRRAMGWPDSSPTLPPTARFFR